MGDAEPPETARDLRPGEAGFLRAHSFPPPGAPVKKKPWYLLGLVFWALVTVPVLFHEHQIDEGHKAFVRLGCANCHLSGGAPNLANILRQYDKPTIEEFIRDPEAVYRRLGRRPLNPGFTTMHRLKISPSETRLIASYLKSL